MSKPLFTALLIATAPVAAFAQTDTSTGSTAGISSAARPAPTANQNNPQAQANMAGQPRNAHTVPGSGAASAIPTPTLSHKMQKVPGGQGVSKSDAIR